MDSRYLLTGTAVFWRCNSLFWTHPESSGGIHHFANQFCEACLRPEVSTCRFLMPSAVFSLMGLLCHGKYEQRSSCFGKQSASRIGTHPWGRMPGSRRMDLVKKRVRIGEEDFFNRDCWQKNGLWTAKRMDCVKLNVFDLPISTQEFIDLKLKHT